MAIPFSIVECRAAVPDAGTAAAVVHLRSLEPDRWMGDLAGFLAVPVTVFVRAAPGGHRTRLFAGAIELEFSGEGLAAAAHALWAAELVPAADPVVLLTPVGEVSARRAGVAIDLERAGRCVFTLARAATAARGELAWPT